mmetsp:Transcript_26304/g.40357  ORF Transcript_26304/g.40357 Transcript_26304/m.40357 type:complete len:513 (-) Transcript_26304:477-2015(-)|eukprot:CAMPEP_0195298866 /NCGR_PEP_ID=MMETSP0707-20130614/24363_1 /TAXON_ID=33640 /ORGANISM="Asterionellopsis glacialis, Strain CCMP134" /LENGTH=512 /DNA_ID=CAMNT_0040361097 /DNA_START=201 /DNA_END=1739 /DNA_ORIENTATION=-
MIRSPALHSPQFRRLVAGLKDLGKTCTVVESCCGGLISSSLMSVPGSSAVYYGGSIAYNTRRAKKLLLNDSELHAKLIVPTQTNPGESAGDAYIRSKLKWTAETAIAFCKQMEVDYAIAEGGASGPTFRPEGLDKGFAAIAVAGRDEESGEVKLLAQQVVHSTHADREANMRLFANAAADLVSNTVGAPPVEKSSTLLDTPSEPAVWLDRATTLRSDESAIRELEQRPDALHVIIRGFDILFSSTTELALLNTIPSSTENKIFLGLTPEKVPVFAIDVDDSFSPPSECYFSNTRTNAPLLNEHHNELALYATAMSTWKKSHGFCSNCGSPQVPIEGGTCLECINPGCGAKSWPRQDPSIIVLITNRDGTKALLARSARHPEKMHTCLAGFVEAGETFEKAVLREAWEETGAYVDLSSVKYLSSQPWPFPRSSMIGFRACANDELPLDIDPNEIAEASWFDRDIVAAAAKVPGPVMQHEVAEEALRNDPSLKLLIPPKGVLARSLIDNWLNDV